MPTTNLSAAGWAFLVLTTVYLPFAAIRTALRVRRPGGVPTRFRLLVSVLVSKGILLSIALVVAYYEDVALFPAPHLGWGNLALAVAFLVPTLGTLPLRWGWRSPEEKRRTVWRLPNRASDLGWWALVSLVAGIDEEVMFRGVMFQLWQRVLGSWWPSVAVCSVAFALAHFHSGRRSMVVIGLMAIGTHLIVLASGDLYTAMAIHFVYDLLAGAILWRLARRDGLVPAPAVSKGALEQSTRRTSWQLPGTRRTARFPSGQV